MSGRVRPEAFQELVQRAAEGDRRAIVELVARCEAPLRAALRGRLAHDVRRRLDTEDLMQSTLCLALQELPEKEYANERAFLAWIRSVAQGKVKMAVRYHRAARRDARRDEGAPAAELGLAPLTSPLERAMRVEGAQRAAAALLRIDARDRHLVQMRVQQGFSYREIAELLDYPDEDAARHRFRKVLARLQSDLSAGG